VPLVDALMRDADHAARILEATVNAVYRFAAEHPEVLSYVQYDPTTGRFTLPPEQAFCLANADSPAFFSGLFEMLPTWYGNAAKVAEAFKTGTGVPQKEYGEEFWHGFERFTRAQFLNHLTQHWIPAIPGLEAKLQAGATVADIGCGNGQAILILAQAYPRSQFIGYDNYELAIENARKRAAEAEVDGRVEYQLRDVVQGLPGTYDLITVFDTVHDMVDPVGALTSIRKALASDGVLLWTEFNVSGDLAENLANPLNLAKFAYSASTLYCMTTSLHEHGAGIGTCMGQTKAEEEPAPDEGLTDTHIPHARRPAGEAGILVACPAEYLDKQRSAHVERLVSGPRARGQGRLPARAEHGRRSRGSGPRSMQQSRAAPPAPPKQRRSTRCSTGWIPFA